MVFRNWGKLIVASLFFILLVACGKAEETETSAGNEPEKVNEEEQSEEAAGEEEETTEFDITSTENWNPAIEEETGGKVEVLYTNPEANYTNDLDGLIVTVEGYQIVHVTDMNQSQEPYFDGLEGYIVTIKATTENTTGKDLKYNNIMRIQLADQFDYIPSDHKFYVLENWQIWRDRDAEESGWFKAGEKIEYLLAFTFSNEEFARMKSVEPKFIIEGLVSENDDFSDSFGEEAYFDFVYSEEQAKAVANAPDFYPDRMTTDNWVTKEMIYEKTDIHETQEIDGFKVTLEGIQFTKITPNETSKERFRNFPDPNLVALTVKVTYENGSNEVVWNSSPRAALDVNENEFRYLTQSMVANYSPDNLEPGASGEQYLVFIFEEKYFNLYETFSLEVGPFSGDNGTLFGEKSVAFELPFER